MISLRDLIDREIHCLANEVFQALLEKDPDSIDTFTNLGEDEVFQWFFISDWLADKLIEEGEPVAKDFYGQNVWGRTTFGQSLEADSCMTSLYEKLKKEQ